MCVHCVSEVLETTRRVTWQCRLVVQGLTTRCTVVSLSVNPGCWVTLGACRRTDYSVQIGALGTFDQLTSNSSQGVQEHALRREDACALTQCNSNVTLCCVVFQ